MFFKQYEQVGTFGTNNYLLMDESSKEAALIDCTGDFDVIKSDLANLSANLKYVLLTHAHFDHVAGCLEFLEKIKNPNGVRPKLCVHREDDILLENIKAQCAFFGLESVEKPDVDVFIDENSNLSLGSEHIQIIHTPGHTRGGVCFLIDGKLFSGDTLFYEEIGRCDLPGGSFQEIEKSIREKLFILPENIPVYPGHGISSTIGHEKEFNAYFGKNARYV